MVKYMIAEQLLGKEVMTTDGFYLGKFIDAEINEITGKLVSLIIEPNVDSSLVSRLETRDGKLRVEYNAVTAVNDFIVIDRKSVA
jgi:sporulation protein YlmC with PRC-barrel domain